MPKKHHLTIPLHDPLRIGTLVSILTDVAKHHSLSKEDVIFKLFGNDQWMQQKLMTLSCPPLYSITVIVRASVR
ncbi:hypothetical protein [Nitrosomonas nitrosa]|nr:hypothetical protein [Nitrosomonas nitrosa]MCO6434616.1 hypothetical protein [Nitrosomonas nitrosa]